MPTDRIFAGRLKPKEERRGNLVVDLKIAENFFWTLEHYGISIEGSVLADIGCGRAHFSLWAAINGARRVHAFDKRDDIFLHPDRIKGIDNVDREILDRITFKQFDIVGDDVTKFAGMFDLVITHDAFEHFNDPTKALHNISVMVKRGGYLLADAGGLFNSSEGYHCIANIYIPYVQHLFPDKVVFEYLYKIMSEDKENLYTKETNGIHFGSILF